MAATPQPSPPEEVASVSDAAAEAQSAAEAVHEAETPKQLAKSERQYLARIQGLRDSIRERARNMVERFTGFFDKRTAFIDETVGESEGVTKMIVKTLRDAVLGIPALGLRVGSDIGKVGSDAIAGITGTVTDFIFHPKQSISNFREYFSNNILRVVSSMSADLVDLSAVEIERVVQYFTKMTKRVIQEVPAVGTLLGHIPGAVQALSRGSRNLISKVMGKLTPEINIYQPQAA